MWFDSVFNIQPKKHNGLLLNYQSIFRRFTLKRSRFIDRVFR